MKNEKMKRVAALALAGTMMASVVSPAAFATDDDSVPPTEGLVPPATNEEETTAPAKAPATVESAHKVDKGEEPVSGDSVRGIGNVIGNEIGSEVWEKVESGELTEEEAKAGVEDLGGNAEFVQGMEDAIQDNTEIVAVNPTVPTDEGDVQIPEESDLSLDDEGNLVTGEDTSVDTDGLLGVYDVEGMLGDMQDAVDKVDDENPLKAPMEDALDQMEEELPDVIIGADPNQEIEVSKALNDNDPASDEPELGINPGVVVDVDTTEKEDFDEEEKKESEGIEDNLEGQLNKGTPVEEVEGVVVGDKTYNVIEVTEDKKDETDDGWNLVEDSLTQTVMTKDYTFVISSEDDMTTENAPLTAQEMAEILGVELDENSVVNESNKLISFKDSNGNTYTVEKNFGTDTENQTTNVFWKVNVTETKTTHKESAKVEDSTEVVDGSLEKDESETVIVGADENPGAQVVGDHTDLGLTKAQIQDYLNGKTPEGYELVTGEDGVTKLVNKTNSNISYTITSVATGENIACTAEELAGKSDEEIKALLGDNFSKGDDGKIYYTVDGEEYEAHFKDGEIGQTLAVTIVKTDTKGAESDVKAEIDANRDGTAETVVGADSIEAQDAALQAQLKEEAEAKLKEVLGDKFTSLDGVEWEINGDEWTATVPEDGIEKTYKVTVAQKSESSLDGELIDAVTPDQSQTVDVNGSAFVTKGEITWTGEYGPVYDCQGDEQEYNGLARNFKDGKPVFDGEGGSVEEAESYEGKTFQGNTVSDVEVSKDGKTYTITTVGSDGLKKVYEFSYESVNADRVESALEHRYDGKDFTDVEAEADLTKLSWTVTTEKKQEQCVTDKTTVDGDIKEDNHCFEKDGDLYVKFEGEGCVTQDDKVVIEEKPDGSWTAEGKDKDAKYTATAEDMTIEEVEAMLKEQGKTDVVVTQNTETGKFEVTYKKDGNTYSATYDAKDVTVEKKEDIQLSGKDDCYNSIYQALEQAYGQPGSGNGSYQIEEYETFLNGAEDSEENRKAFVDSLAKSEDMTTTTTVEVLEGQALKDAIQVKNPNADKSYQNHFNLHAEINLKGDQISDNVLINSSNSTDKDASTAKVEYGTLGQLVDGNPGGHEFNLSNDLTTGSSKQTHLEYEQSSGNTGKPWSQSNADGDEWYGPFYSVDGDYYHVTGTLAYTSKDAQNEEAFKNSYTDKNTAEQKLAEIKQTYSDAVLVEYKDNRGNTEYRIYEKTGSVNAYGYLDRNSNVSDTGNNGNACSGKGYDLRLDDIEQAADGNFYTKGTYETKTSWSATLTMVQKKEGSVLTVDNLYKITQNRESCGGRTSGTYEITQTLDVRNCQDTPTSAGNAIYSSGKVEAEYVISQDWLTTTDTYTADANQYGKVTVEGEDGKEEQKDAFLQFNYDTVKFEASADSKADVTHRFVYAELTKTPAPTENPDGPGEGGEETPEIPEQPEGPTLILTDVPVEEEILDEPTALAPAPEETVIEDEDTPLAADPETDAAEIEDEDTPLSAVPKTGDESGIFLLMSAVSGMALAALSFIDRKGRHSRFGSQHSLF